MAKVLPYTNPDYVLELTGQTVALTHCDAATAIIDKHVGNSKIMSGGGLVTMNYSGDNGFYLDLGYYPIKTVQSVYLNGTLLVADTSQYQSDDDPDDTSPYGQGDYMTPAQHGEADGYLYRGDGWDMGQGNITVTFSYDTSADMELIRFVASMIAAYIKNEIFTNVKQETIGTYSVQYVVDNSVGNTQIDRYLEMLPKHFSITAAGGEGEPKDIREDLYNQYDINYYANGLN